MENSTLLFIVIGALGLYLIYTYNQLVSLRNQIENTFASIDTMLQKRFDLIPQIVNTVKGYMQHEALLLQKLTELRSQSKESHLSDNQKINLSNELTLGLNQLFVRVEAYPDLKAGENFLHLQRTINEVEEQLSAARRTYNMAVTIFNTKIQSFPVNLIASAMGFKARTLFQLDSELQAQTPEIKL
ncbi:MAG: LemA family protein [Cyclobacteriaceae bacterium]|nr:LemA family protein [Cyclobacteriaceae bacterium]MCH8517858.1 LemA family protein [Cyclobacteriaceae bacterium]